MNPGILGRLRTFLRGASAGPGTVPGSIWKDGEEFILVGRSEWEPLQRDNRELKEQLAQALALIRELQAENAALRAENAALSAENAALKLRVEALEEKLRTSSLNSSKPPSSDPPSVERPPRRDPQKGKRKQGAVERMMTVSLHGLSRFRTGLVLQRTFDIPQVRLVRIARHNAFPAHDFHIGPCAAPIVPNSAKSIRIPNSIGYPRRRLLQAARGDHNHQDRHACFRSFHHSPPLTTR